MPRTAKPSILVPKPATSVLPLLPKFKAKRFGKATIGANWRIVIPTEVRDALHLKPGDDLVFVENELGEMVARTPDQLLQSIRDSLAKNVPTGVSLSQELIAERRAEAAREIDD